jgi:hypothetical protein
MLLAASFATLAVGAVGAPTAGAVSIYWWAYNNAWTTNTNPAARTTASNAVGPAWLGNSSGPSSRMLGGPCTPGNPCGGINADVATTTAGDYCNEYRLPVFGTNTSWPFSVYTGFSPSSPLQSYQQTDGASQQASTCQAQGDASKYGWGQWIQPADPGTCGGPADGVGFSSCGIHHYLSLAGTSDYPWANVFGNPELTFVSTMKVGAYSDHWTAGSQPFFAWHHLCPVLGVMRNGHQSVLELCAMEWRSSSAISWPPFVTPSGSAPLGNHVDCAQPDRAEAIAPMNPANPAGGFLTTITGSGQSGTITNGATGQWTFQGTITKQNLLNVINAMPANCQAATSWSTDPSQYQLLGFEDGIEAGGAANYLNYFGSSESQLAAWTAY